MKKKENKVLFVYDRGDGEFEIESLWADKVGDYYKIDNIPFFAKNIAWGDIVKVENDNGSLYFDELIEPSGHSVVRILFKNKDIIDRTKKELLEMGCSLESHRTILLAIDIPPDINYEQIKLYLIQGTEKNLWEFQEACLGFK